MPREQTDVCKTVVKFPYDDRSLYGGLDVKTMSATAVAKSNALSLCTNVRFELVVGSRLCG